MSRESFKYRVQCNISNVLMCLNFWVEFRKESERLKNCEDKFGNAEKNKVGHC